MKYAACVRIEVPISGGSRILVGVLHELWVDRNGLDTFCLAGPMGDDARALLDQPAELVWTVEAASHFEAMTLYYEFRGLGKYTTDQDWDRVSYRDHGWE